MSALCLRILASVCMLLDHIGYLLPQYPVLRYIGRLAFPIYVFLLVNGYRFTSSRLRYVLRLGLFALLSQIPFSLFCGYESLWNKGNVFFTLLVALLVLWATDRLTKKKVLRFLSPLPAVLAYGLYYFGLLHTDYDAKGFLLALVFFYLGNRKLLCLGASLLVTYHTLLVSYALQLKNLLLGGSVSFARPSQWQLLQLLSLLGLLPIFLYNGKKGKTPASPWAKATLQWGFYLFYPVHLLILYLVS